MAEGYVFTSAADVNDLLNQIVSQAAVHGWSQRHLGGLGASGRRGHISKDGVFVNLASAQTIATDASAGTTLLNTIIPSADRASGNSYNWSQSLGGGVYVNPDVLCINGSTGYDSAVGWYRQPGADVQNDANPNQGRFSLIRAKGAIGKVYMFFYENPTALLVVCEVRPGEFYWLAAGNLQKDSPFTGGQYYGASLRDLNTVSAYPGQLSNMMIRVEHAEVARTRGQFWGGSYVTSPSYSMPSSPWTVKSPDRVPGYWVHHSSTNPSLWSEVQDRGYDPASGRLWLHPPLTYAVRPNDSKSLIGVLPHVHYSTVENFVGADIVTIGGEEYMVFPANWRKSPYSRNDTTDSSLGVPWYRNNHYGSGFAARKPI